METRLKTIWRPVILNHKQLFLVSLLFFILSGCDKEVERLDDYLVEIATVQKENATYRFKLDNNRILIPEEIKNYSGNDGQRVILRYVPLKDNNIRIINISNIFTAGIQHEGYPEKYSDDPVKIQSVWVGSDYLNLILEIEYHSVPHGVALLRNNSSTSVDLYFSHSRNNDPRGYPQTMHASFSLKDLHSLSNTFPVPFRLFINTHSGMREFWFELK
ncbi:MULTISPECIES: hypothetical protein [Proteiniphilum]|jgi:hypothetical protein|uniref:NigD1/NigD2 family lipoprotein n=1 Tax=Proteiniphilum TaxID=294702 RepID=UPI001EEC71FE|nr:MULTISPECIES: NigD-like C-terminal domain-containing protein [Proteiniphilum]ULB34163.1 NigD-like N-terminal domain-containing protein [Proteiniphilum propionicum]